MDTELAANLKEVRGRVERAARVSGRSAGNIHLIAVTKKVKVERIENIIDQGVKSLGENRVQEMLEKIPCLPGEVEWHLIGHLQRNKVKYIIDKVSMIQSLDRWSLAEEIQKRAHQRGVTVPVLVQVNLAGEKSKFGLAENEVPDFLAEVVRLQCIRVQGLMTMAPFTADPEETRPVFQKARLLAGKVKESMPGISMNYLSMGMTNDFEVAIEEGANMVRIGSALFGARKY